MRPLLLAAMIVPHGVGGDGVWVSWRDRRGPEEWLHYLDLSSPGAEPYSYRCNREAIA